jgi:HEAT repeat protein
VGRGLPDDALTVALDQDDMTTACIVGEAAAQMDASRVMSGRLMAARSPRLRRLGLLRLMELSDDTAEKAARQALLDSHVHVRSGAQSCLRRFGVAASPIYATFLESRPAVAIIGLAETGTKEDAGRVIPFASHSSARVRDAVRLALTKLAPHDYRDTLLGLARDQSARVARHAACAIISSNPGPAETRPALVICSDAARQAGGTERVRVS